MDQAAPEIAYLQSADTRTIATEDTYVVLCRPISNGAYILEYVERGRTGNLLAAVRVDMPPTAAH